MESGALVNGLAPGLVPRWPVRRRGGGAGGDAGVAPGEMLTLRCRPGWPPLHFNDARALLQTLTPPCGPLDVGQLCILITMEGARIDV